MVDIAKVNGHSPVRCAVYVFSWAKEKEEAKDDEVSYGVVGACWPSVGLSLHIVG